MAKVFEKGRRLIEIIDEHDWLLYDFTFASRIKRKDLLERLGKRNPAEDILRGHNYCLIPKPIDGESILEAYESVDGIGPYMQINNPDDSRRWEDVRICKKNQLNEFFQIPDNSVFFSRLFFYNGYVIGSDLSNQINQDFDMVAMRENIAVDNFRRYFDVLKPKEREVIAIASDRVTYLH